MQESKTPISGRMKSAIRSVALATICFALSNFVAAPLAVAETRTYSQTGVAIEGAWTTCPQTTTRTLDCTFTVTYAARSNKISPVVVITMTVLRMYSNGSIQLMDTATGAVQPAAVNVPQSTLTNASASGRVNLFGNCADPNNISTCWYYGPASISGRWTAIAGATSWNEQKGVTNPQKISYTLRITGAARPANGTGSATFNGGNWPLGRSAYARVLQFGNNESLTCPSVCPSMAKAKALVAADPSKAIGRRSLFDKVTLDFEKADAADSQEMHVGDNPVEPQEVFDSPYNYWPSYQDAYSLGQAERAFRNDPVAWSMYSSIMNGISPYYWQMRTSLENSLFTGGFPAFDQTLSGYLRTSLSGVISLGLL